MPTIMRSPTEHEFFGSVATEAEASLTTRHATYGNGQGSKDDRR